MSTYIQTASADITIPTRWFQNLRSRIARYRLQQQTINELSALSDRELEDVGLHRSMIKSVADQPLRRRR